MGRGANAHAERSEMDIDPLEGLSFDALRQDVLE
jgi:hypothetical protein